MRPGELREAAVLYALGALDPVSTRRFERHLQTAQTSDRNEVHELIETAALLPLALPRPEVPARLKQRLLTQIERDNNRFMAMSPVQKRKTTIPRWLLIAATVLLTFGSGLLFWQNRQLLAEREQMRTRIESGDTQLASLKQQWEEVLSPATRVVTLSGDAAPQATAKLLWDTRTHQWIIHIQNLPAQPEDKDYQLWFLTENQNKISAAIFRTDEQGHGEIKVAVPPHLATKLTATAVSLEPRGGSPQPTGQIYLKGTV